MNNNPKIDIVIPAAGVGKRMGANIPKQYLKIGNKTILEHTINKFLQFKFVNKVIVVIGAEDPYFAKLNLTEPNIETQIGGAERCFSVLEGLKKASTEFVLVHDAARPCVKLSDVENLVLQCLDDNGGILGCAIPDTIKRITDKGVISATIPRTNMYRALTPQFFKRELLIHAYESAISKNQILTDESSAMEILGYTPKLIVGDATNIKITEPNDLKLAQIYLEQM